MRVFAVFAFAIAVASGEDVAIEAEFGRTYADVANFSRALVYRFFDDNVGNFGDNISAFRLGFGSAKVRPDFPLLVAVKTRDAGQLWRLPTTATTANQTGRASRHCSFALRRTVSVVIALFWLSFARKQRIGRSHAPNACGCSLLRSVIKGEMLFFHL